MSRIPTLRLDELTKKLARFGVTVRDAKGSECVFSGNKLISKTFARFRVGRHKANREVHSQLIQAILRRFEIDTADFLNDNLH